MFPAVGLLEPSCRKCRLGPGPWTRDLGRCSSALSQPVWPSLRSEQMTKASCPLLVFRAPRNESSFHMCSQEVSRNLTKDNEQIKEDVEGIRGEMSKHGKENCSRNAVDNLPGVGSALQRDAAAAFAHPEVGQPRAWHRAELSADPLPGGAWPSCSPAVSRVEWGPVSPNTGPREISAGTRTAEVSVSPCW